MRADQNELITRIGPGTPCGNLMRAYWQPVALVDEFDPALDPRMALRAVKAVRLLGQDLVLFRDAQGHWGLLDRDCPHRGADLSFGRLEPDGLRCPFHGWKFAADGTCLQTPAEPAGSRLCERVRQRSYPVLEKSGVLFAWMGEPGSVPPPFPQFDCFVAPGSHSFAFKGLWSANWLQCFEVGIDPAHPSFLHRFFQDASFDDSYGKQFRGASAGEVDGERWPMTRIMREFVSPEISSEPTAFGLRLTALRPLNDRLTHVRVTNADLPAHLRDPAVRDHHDHADARAGRRHAHLLVRVLHQLRCAAGQGGDAPAAAALRVAARLPAQGRPAQRLGLRSEDQRSRTFLGMGEDDINVHDQWAVESMGAIQDRTREHLGTSDKVIIANRRLLVKAIETVRAAAWRRDSPIRRWPRQ
jgi:phthalate 4,5-dioxygenase oxygenase subunit